MFQVSCLVQDIFNFKNNLRIEYMTNSVEQINQKLQQLDNQKKEAKAKRDERNAQIANLMRKAKARQEEGDKIKTEVNKMKNGNRNQLKEMQQIRRNQLEEKQNPQLEEKQNPHIKSMMNRAKNSLKLGVNRFSGLFKRKNGNGKNTNGTSGGRKKRKTRKTKRR